MHPLRIAMVSLALLATFVVATGASPGPPKLPDGWSHAEINVTIGGVPHTMIYDQGIVKSVSSGSLKLKERDGTVVVIEVARNARVTINGQRSTLQAIRPGYTALTVRINGKPARRVTAATPRKGKNKAQRSSGQSQRNASSRGSARESGRGAASYR